MSIPKFSNDPMGRACRAACEDIEAGGDAEAALNRLLNIVSRDNRQRNIQAMQAKRGRVAAAKGDPVALRKLANENLGRRK